MSSSTQWHHQIHPLLRRHSFPLLLLPILLLVAALLFSPSAPNRFISSFGYFSPEVADTDIWSARRVVDWRPCVWWKNASLPALPAKTNGYIRVDCYGGLNQMRRDFCDGIGIARILNATLVLPKFEVAAYWNESSGFADVFDIDYFIQQTQGFVEVVKELPEEITSREPFRVDCSKRKGQFDYVEGVLPALLEHRYISLTPAMSQRRDRFQTTTEILKLVRRRLIDFDDQPAVVTMKLEVLGVYAKAALCQGCYNALRLNKALEAKGSELFKAIPKPFLTLHLRFEPDMVAYSKCDYPGLSSTSLAAIEAARGDRKSWTGDAALSWRNRGKCPLTPKETAFILQSLKIPTNTTIYLAAGDGLLEMEGFTSVYTNVYTKSSLLNSKDFNLMHGNTKAALDYYVSINSNAYIATYFGNMDKMVSAMRAANVHYRTLALSRRAFANLTALGLEGVELADALWKSHREDFVMGRGTALPDCFCESTL